MRSCLRSGRPADIPDGLPSSPNLILLDINMPGGAGIEVLKRLRVFNRTQQIPVIVISSEQSCRRINGTRPRSSQLPAQTD